MRYLPPPFSGFRNLCNIKSYHTPASTPALLHTVCTRIGRAFLCLALTLLASCRSDDEVHFVKMSEYYAESCRLDQVTQDSIASFARKVADYVAVHPLAKQDPLYPRILTNIRNSSLDQNITIDTDWSGETEMKF